MSISDQLSYALFSSLYEIVALLVFLVLIWFSAPALYEGWQKIFKAIKARRNNQPTRDLARYMQETVEKIDAWLSPNTRIGERQLHDIQGRFIYLSGQLEKQKLDAPESTSPREWLIHLSQLIPMLEKGDIKRARATFPRRVKV